MVQKSIYIDRVNIFRKVQRKIRDQPIRLVENGSVYIYIHTTHFLLLLNMKDNNGVAD